MCSSDLGPIVMVPRGTCCLHPRPARHPRVKPEDDEMSEAEIGRASCRERV